MDWTKFNELSILIIDDDQFTRELIKTILKQVPSITTYQAIDANNALAIMDDLKLDMIFLDLYMPKMNGQEFTEIIRKHNKFQSLPIVLITTDRLSKQVLEEIGVNYYLTKPFDFQNFVGNVYSFLEQETLKHES